MANEIADKIRAAAIAKGLDPNVALRIAGVESSYDPSIKNPRSSAKGLFQVTDDTWRRYGGKPGKQRDVDENIRVGMDILADNTNKLSKILGRAPRPSELYTAHFFGTGTGAQVLRSDADTPINKVVSKKVMAANPELRGLTVGQLMAKHEAKFARTPGTPAYAGKKGGERQDDTQQMMTDSLSSGQTAQAPVEPQAPPTVLDDPRIKALGTNYQMALAATTLADKNDDPDDDGMTESERFQKFMEEKQAEATQVQEPSPARKALASFDLSYKSPFVDEAPAQQPVQMALGGMVAPPPAVGIRPSQKAAIQSANEEWEKYKSGIDTYNTEVERYNSEAQKAKAAADAWLAGYEKAGEPPINPKTGKLYTLSTFGDLGKTKRQNEYAEKTPAPSFTMAAPVQPTAPTVQPKELAARAQRDARNRNIAISAFFEPEKYNLSFSHGGAVHRAGGSPEEGERMTPQQIEQVAQRQQDARDYRQMMMDAPTRGDTYSGFFKGVTQNLVPNVVGIPVDLTTMALRPFGYKVEKPVLGSEWNKEKLTEYGLRPEPPAEGTNERNFYDVGNFASFFVNPASATRNAITTGEKLVQKGTQAVETTKKGAQKAKDMLNALKKPKEPPQTAPVEPIVAPAVPQIRLVEPPAPVQQAEPLPPPPAEVAVPPEMVPPPPPLTQLPEVTPVAAPMQAGVPADRPFVGRLDAFIDTIKNPVQLGQLKGQLKNKFRDYDIERVERAFAGMDDKTKLTPDQIKQALAGVHSPGKWISETIPPKPNAHHQTVDNVWGAELGTTNLYLEQPAERVAATKLLDEGQLSIAAFIANSSHMPTVKHLENAKKLLNNPELEQIAGPELINNLKLKFDKAEGNINKIDEMNNEILQIGRGFTNPVLYVAEDGTQPWFKLQEKFVKDKVEALKQQYIQQGATPTSAYIAASDDIYAGANGNRNHQEAGAFASKKVQEMALERARAQGIPEPDLSLINWNDPNLKPMSPATKEFEESVKNVLEPSIQTVHEASKNVQRFMDKEVAELGKKLLSAAAYRGKHKHVTAGPYPIGFTRFSEHQATVPGVGTIEGRHFHELQSDLSKDMRKSGTTHGNEQKDIKEGMALTTQIQKLRLDAFNELSRIQKDFKDGVITYDEFKPRSDKVHQKLEEQVSPLEKRYSILNARVRDKAPYSLEEPFAGFETNQMVRQQLLMKNAIQAAMRDGKRFATFPGNESDKPQLYVGKVLPNLKQVIKDLGGEKAGFELRQIELPPDKHGNPITATGVIWSPEAAARIVEKGVPFAKGGMVERNSADNRRYL